MGQLPTADEWSKDPRTRIGARFQSIEARQAKLETARTFVFVPVQADTDGLTLPSAWTEYLVTNVPVPAGYSKALVLMFCSAGASFVGSSGSGTVMVQAAIAGVTGVVVPGTSPGAGAVSVASTLAPQIQDLAPGASLRLSMFASSAASGGVSQVTATGNVHLSGQVMFIR